MERLTCKRRNSDRYLVSCLSACRGGDCWDCVEFGKIIDRLATYEDTGLTPEDCKKAVEMENVLMDEYYSINRMIELMRADKDGRVVVLPCRVGDTVWRLQYVDKGESSSPRFPIEAVEAQFNLWMLSEFGQTVFLTREEAEEALRRLENEHTK